jgi:hypothetical protein
MENVIAAEIGVHVPGIRIEREEEPRRSHTGTHQDGF